MDKYEKLKQETEDNIKGQEMIDAFKPLEKLVELQSSKLPKATVTIYQEDYTVEYTAYDNEIEIQSIDGHSDIEDTFKDSFVTQVIEKIQEHIDSLAEYKAEQRGDEGRGN
jgi:hypothetical protein